MKKIMLTIATTGIFALTALAGCEQLNAPHVMGNEVPEGAVNAPRLVARPAPTTTETWPRLGDVPAKPTDFSPQPVIDQARSEMENDRADAEQLRARVEQGNMDTAPALSPTTLPPSSVATPSPTSMPTSSAPTLPALTPPQLKH